MNDLTPAERKIGKPMPFRAYQDQEEWIERMVRERSANPAEILRKALDAYRPIFEAIGDRSEEAERKRVLERLEQILRTVPPGEVLAAAEALEDTRIENAGCAR